MTRRKPHSGPGATGLFTWLTDGEVALDQITANPLTAECHDCGAAIGQRCTRPSRWARGRAERAPHDSRLKAADAAQEPRTEPR